ncbi:hypothetical protein GA0115255_105634 [Streptomyces sp. Ncost-T6T-2b]|nr:hypothetical protein GA0115255_105634 [Streptomyces sp. Ncost-T6T-2b]
MADPAADTLAEARHELKSYLLGPDEPTSMEQFNAALHALAAKAEARNAGVAQRAAGQPVVSAGPDPEDSSSGAGNGEQELSDEAAASADPDAVGASGRKPATGEEASRLG